MDYGYALLMFCIGGALLLYSVILIKTENISLVVQMDKDRIQNKNMACFQMPFRHLETRQNFV